jgi:hypothetical protein
MANIALQEIKRNPRYRLEQIVILITLLLISDVSQCPSYPPHSFSERLVMTRTTAQTQTTRLEKQVDMLPATHGTR